MQSNPSYFSPDGAVLDFVEPRQSEHLNSIRHLAIDRGGQVAMALQWQGATAEAPALLVLHRRGGALRMCRFGDDAHRVGLQGYAGSVAFSGDGKLVGITSPIGGEVQIFDAGSEAPMARLALLDTCGLAAAGIRLMATAGTGRIARI